MKAFFFVLTLSLFFTSVSYAGEPGFADKALGRWDLTVTDHNGQTYPSWFEITLRTEKEIMARFVGRFGSQRFASSVNFKNGQLRLEVPVQYEAGTAPLVFEGELKDETLQGTTKDEKGESLSWKATRAPSLVRPSAPVWGETKSLFNGSDLSGWRLRSESRGACWAVEEGALTNQLPCTDLKTESVYSDFKLHAEFKMPSQGNSGIYLRGRYEFQLNDGQGQAADPLRLGGVYGFIRPLVMAALAPGEWQSCDITLIGRRISAVLNGQKVIEDTEIPGITGGALDSDEAQAGAVMLQGDHTKVWFRELKITPVP